MRSLLIPFQRRGPLWQLTAIALLSRLLAAIFSQGYFAHDDHFLVIEAAQSWADGHDYNNWLPWDQGAGARPSGHSFFYVGLHFLLFKGLNVLGVGDPKAKMLVVRLLHALWSLIVVRSGYRIALRISGSEKIAWNAGLLLALFYFMPFLAVRQLVEVTCIPLLMLGTEQFLAIDQRPTNNGQRSTHKIQRTAFLAGLFLGLAINIRFQTLFFAAGPGLVLLFSRWRTALAYGAGVFLPLALIQGGIDLFLWGRPFAEITEYVRYNFANPTTYGELPWYNYLLLLAAVFVPPLSLAVFFGFFASWRRQLLIWAPVFLFLAAHSYFPNKQERFIFPILPLFFVIGWCGWEQWRSSSAWWRGRGSLWPRTLIVVWVLNVILLVPITISYSKRSRCEAFYALRQAPWAVGVVVEDVREHEPPQAPLFYWGNWNAVLVYVPDTTIDLRAELDKYGPERRPNVVMFIGAEDLDARRRRVEQQLGVLQELGTARPGLLDRLVHWLNPVNRNETVITFRIVNDRP